MASQGTNLSVLQRSLSSGLQDQHTLSCHQSLTACHSLRRRHLFISNSRNLIATLIGFDRFLKVRSTVWQKVLDTFYHHILEKMIKNLEKNQSYIDCLKNSNHKKQKYRLIFILSFSILYWKSMSIHLYANYISFE